MHVCLSRGGGREQGWEGQGRSLFSFICVSSMSAYLSWLGDAREEKSACARASECVTVGWEKIGFACVGE